MAERDRPDVPPAQATLCPYCGHVSGHPQRCRVCGGRFDPLSRQATQNTMGPWYVRDEKQPYLPGCSYETMRRMVRRGRVSRASIVRGPTTMQFWVIATKAPGVAHLLGECHSCHGGVSPDDSACLHCDASFEVGDDRQRLGLAPVHLLPGQASAEQIAAYSDDSSEAQEAEPVISTTAFDAEERSQKTEATSTEGEDAAGEGTKRRGSRPRVAARVGLILLVLGACAGGTYLAFERGVFEAPGFLSHDPTTSAEPSEANEVARAPKLDSAPAAEAGGEAEGVGEGGEASAARPGVVSLLRDGRVDDALEAIDAGESPSPMTRTTVLGRLDRDRIRAFLDGR